MSQEIKNIKEACALVLRAWRQASPFFLSIELLLMLLLSFVTVAGVWLAVMGDLRCLPAFAAAAGAQILLDHFGAPGQGAPPFGGAFRHHLPDAFGRRVDMARDGHFQERCRGGVGGGHGKIGRAHV